jgi:hypothetical protein
MINWRHPDAESECSFDKLRRAGSAARGNELQKAAVGRLEKRATNASASSEALRKRVDRLDGQFAEVAAALRRIEVNKAVVERDALAVEKISAAVHAANRAIGPDDLAKAVAERAGRNFFH